MFQPTNLRTFDQVLGCYTGGNLFLVIGLTKKRLLPIGNLSDLLHHKCVPIDMFTMIYVNIKPVKSNICMSYNIVPEKIHTDLFLFIWLYYTKYA